MSFVPQAFVHVVLSGIFHPSGQGSSVDFINVHEPTDIVFPENIVGFSSANETDKSPIFIPQIPVEAENFASEIDDEPMCGSFRPHW